MRLRGAHCIALASVLALGACTAVPVHESLPVAAQDKISSTEVVMPIRQSEIYVFVPSSQLAAAGGGGLLLALVDAGVDSVRTSKAETAVKPLRDALVDFNFDDALSGDMKTSLANVAWLHVGNVRAMKEVTSDTLDGALAASKADAVLFTTTDYQLSNDGNVLTVTVRAGLFANNAALHALKTQATAKPVTAAENALYHNTLTFETKLPNSTKADRGANIARWDAQKGALMRDQLKLAAADISQMLADDLAGTAQSAPGKADPNYIINGGGSAQIIRTDSDGRLDRLPDGRLEYRADSLDRP